MYVWSRGRGLGNVASLRSETISKFVIVSEIENNLVYNVTLVVAIVMVNCLNVKKYIMSTTENLAVSVSQEVSDTKSKSRDLSRLVSIPYILFYSNFAIVFKLLLCLGHRLSINRPTKRGKEKFPSDGHCQCEKEMDDHLVACQFFEIVPHSDPTCYWESIIFEN
jgi:hypothetical protein